MRLWPDTDYLASLILYGLKGESREEDDLDRRACMHGNGNIARFRSSENDAKANSLLYVELEG
jgi:hypothetical protein